MKRTIASLLSVLLASSCFAQTFDDIDLSGIPNAFVNGTNADEVNANFQYLQDNLTTLISILQAQGTIAPSTDRFAGTYALSGIEITMDSGTCGGASQNLIATRIYGTATSDGSTLSLSTNDASGEMGIGAGLSYTTGNDSDAYSINANGVITGIGHFSQDGSTFYASATDNAAGSCHEINVAYLTGVRIN